VDWGVARQRCALKRRRAQRLAPKRRRGVRTPDAQTRGPRGIYKGGDHPQSRAAAGGKPAGRERGPSVHPGRLRREAAFLARPAALHSDFGAKFCGAASASLLSYWSWIVGLNPTQHAHTHTHTQLTRFGDCSSSSGALNESSRGLNRNSAKAGPCKMLKIAGRCGDRQDRDEGLDGRNPLTRYHDRMPK